MHSYEFILYNIMSINVDMCMRICRVLCVINQSILLYNCQT